MRARGEGDCRARPPTDFLRWPWWGGFMQYVQYGGEIAGLGNPYLDGAVEQTHGHQQLVGRLRGGVANAQGVLQGADGGG